MTMGLSMALHEHGMIDPWFGHVVNHNLADYLIATSADVGSANSASSAPPRRSPTPPTTPPASASEICRSTWTNSCNRP